LDKPLLNAEIDIRATRVFEGELKGEQVAKNP
jgi:hypothetical protein